MCPVTLVRSHSCIHGNLYGNIGSYFVLFAWPREWECVGAGGGGGGLCSSAAPPVVDMVAAITKSASPCGHQICYSEGFWVLA